MTKQLFVLLPCILGRNSQTPLPIAPATALLGHMEETLHKSLAYQVDHNEKEHLKCTCSHIDFSEESRHQYMAKRSL